MEFVVTRGGSAPSSNTPARGGASETAPGPGAASASPPALANGMANGDHFTRRLSHEAATDNSDDRVFNPNETRYVPGKIYSRDGKLSLGQRLCTWMIHQYHNRTRYAEDSWLNRMAKKYLAFGNCPFPKHGGHLSCSEYTLVAIQRMGVIRGILAGMERLGFRCTMPWIKKFHNFDDPVFREGTGIRGFFKDLFAMERKARAGELKRAANAPGHGHQGHAHAHEPSSRLRRKTSAEFALLAG